MNYFEQKYGMKEDDGVKAFHRSRRMFCIYKGVLHIAEPNLPYSHAAWFEKEGWMTKETDGSMAEIVRGMINDQGDVYFYAGYDFRVDEHIEAIFFPHLKELAEKLGLDPNARIFGGLIKSAPGTIWPAAKEYGTLGEQK